MGATNLTLHYNLSQFISTDKPAWLQDYNGDMQKIDTGINGALVAAESAQNSADSASSGVSSLNDAVSALSTTVAGHTSDITDLSGDVNTIESLIGNGTPTAGDHTLIGAINTNTNDINESLNKDWSVALAMSSTTTRTYTLPSDAKEVMIFASYTSALVGSSDVYPISFVKSFNPSKVTSMYTSGGGNIFYGNLSIDSDNVATLTASSGAYCALLYR